MMRRHGVRDDQWERIAPLLPGIAAPVPIAGRSYDAEARVLVPLRDAGKVAAIPPKRRRVVRRAYDGDLYGARHLVKHFFCRLKQHCAIATIHFTASVILLA